MLTRAPHPLVWTWALLCAVGCRSLEAEQPVDFVEAEAPSAASREAPAEPAAAVSTAGSKDPKPVAAWAAPVVEDPGTPTVDRERLLDAPTRYEHVTLRAGLPVSTRYEDLIYEGNNMNFRGKADATGLYRSGETTALDWRRWIAGIKGMIVLRDSLYSQQDHPVLQAPRALMLPPSWVSVAVAVAMGEGEGAPLLAPLAPAVEDDAAWAELSSAQARFGSFPPSERLFEESRRSLASPEAEAGDHAKTRNARASIRALSAAAGAMVQARAQGPEAVADAGAAWISASDRTYFGAELRTRTIPIFVENPNEHEMRDEGKGMGSSTRAACSTVRWA